MKGSVNVEDYEAMQLRSRFKEINCKSCNNVGVVRVKRPDKIPALALCDCDQGSRLPWNLPRVKALPGLLDEKEVMTQPLPYWDFHPGVHAKTLDDEGIKSFIPERVQWWKEKIKTSEELWKSEDDARERDRESDPRLSGDK